MDQAVKEAWVKALRSGDYEQGRDGLHNDANQFCCLGVLCDQWAGEWSLNAHYGATYDKRSWYDFQLAGHDTTMAGSLAASWREEFGLTNDEESALIKLNDNENADFNDIADWIETFL